MAIGDDIDSCCWPERGHNLDSARGAWLDPDRTLDKLAEEEGFVLLRLSTNH